MCAWPQAARSSFNGALRIAYRAGTVTGMLTDGLGLFGGTIIFIIFGVAAPDALLGFGFGGTLLALFMRVGGGIYTKAADVGADLVGKVEQDLPEDDPRNAAVIADLVGDNVGDCAGMAADIFESYEVTIVSALILGLALRSMTGNNEWLIYPLLVRGIGVLSSIFGTYLVKSEPGMSGDAMSAIFRGFLTSAAISTVLFGIVAFFYMRRCARRLVAALPGHRRRRAAGHRHRPPDRTTSPAPTARPCRRSSKRTTPARPPPFWPAWASAWKPPCGPLWSSPARSRPRS